ncbi:MAG: hypothetical protein Q8Q90_03355 [bacterium]|nr:hypothetical protein [bacterium]
MKTISFNGQDNSGKSQQIRLLKWKSGEHFHITKPLSAYSNRWPKLSGYEASRWWFEEIPVEELTDIIIESLIARQEDSCSEKFPIYDRGVRMFKSVCTATRMTRDGISLHEAITITDKHFDRRYDHFVDEYEIFFERDLAYFSGVQKLVEVIRPREDKGFPESIKQIYLRYQSNLTVVMRYYFSQSARCSIIGVRDPILVIQNQLREILSIVCEVKIPRIKLPEGLIVGFGGLSECGKSSFAEHLRKDYQFCRLKLRYFIELIEKRGEVMTPEMVCLELLDYLERHYFLSRISVESLHDPFVPAMLKLMLGEQVKIVYIETDQDLRIKRASAELGMDFEEAREIVIGKDRVKKGRGAEKVKDVADIVFDNSSNSLHYNLQSFTDSLCLN